MALILPCSARQILHHVAQKCTSTGRVGCAGNSYCIPARVAPCKAGGAPPTISRCCQARMPLTKAMNSKTLKAKPRHIFARERGAISELIVLLTLLSECRDAATVTLARTTFEGKQRRIHFELLCQHRTLFTACIRLAIKFLRLAS